jgi:hypothetical protein
MSKDLAGDITPTAKENLDGDNEGKELAGCAD